MTSTPGTFEFPIGVLLFNQPEYARQVLTSLAEQTLDLDQTRVVVSIDGYAGSKDQLRGLPDQTAEVAQVARELLPNARVVMHTDNLGIARNFDFVERAVFDMDKSRWALFLEHDFVLNANYLEIISSMINYFADTPVAQLSATGDTHELNWPRQYGFHVMRHAWAFALSRDFWVERTRYTDVYLDSTKGQPYYKRDRVKAFRALTEVGLFSGLGVSQDAVKEATLYACGRIAVTTHEHHGRYIGEAGEHFTPELFDRLGFQNWDSLNANFPDFKRPAQDIAYELFRDQVHLLYMQRRGMLEIALAAKLNQSSLQLIPFLRGLFNRTVARLHPSLRTPIQRLISKVK
jgi:glycosyltransferase involved in cell wall biosynthesis